MPGRRANKICLRVIYSTVLCCFNTDSVLKQFSRWCSWCAVWWSERRVTVWFQNFEWNGCHCGCRNGGAKRHRRAFYRLLYWWKCMFNDDCRHSVKKLACWLLKYLVQFYRNFFARRYIYILEIKECFVTYSLRIFYFCVSILLDLK